MTLDEAIKHCEEVAEYNENELSHIDVYNAELAGDASRCVECAADHRQLAEWLRELAKAKELLKETLVIAKNCHFCDESYCNICKNFGCEWGGGDIFEWEHADEAIALIGEEGEQK